MMMRFVLVLNSWKLVIGMKRSVVMLVLRVNMGLKL